MKQTLRILIVDDDTIDRMQLKRLLKPSDFILHIDEATDGVEGIEKAKTNSYDALFLDYMLPKQNGLEVLKSLHQEHVYTPVIMLTGQGDEKTAVEIMKAGAADYLSKDSLNQINLNHSLTSVLKVHRLEEESRNSRLKLEMIVKQTSGKAGWEFLESLVSFLSEMLYTELVCIAFYDSKRKRFYLKTSNSDLSLPHYFTLSEQLKNFLATQPFEHAHASEFPNDKDLLNVFKDTQFCGTLLDNSDGLCLGVTLIFNSKEFEISEQDLSFLHLFRARIRSEIEMILKKNEVLDNEKQLRAIFDNSFDAIAVFHKANLIMANRACVDLFHYSSVEELYAIDFSDVIPEELNTEEYKYLYKLVRKVQSANTYESIELKGVTQEGKEIDLSVHLTSYRADGKHLIVATLQDITELKRSTEAIAMEKERLSKTLSSINDGVFTIDIECNIVLLNNSAARIIEEDEPAVVKQNLFSFCEIINTRSEMNQHTLIKDVLETGKTLESKSYCGLRVFKSDKTKQIELSVSPVRNSKNDIMGAVLVLRDITERRKIEEELAKASKIESIGILAGGIAHDFNNLLTAIIGNISLTKMLITSNDKALKRLVEAEKATLRARDLTQQLLTFSKGGTPINKTVESLSSVLKESAEFVLRGSGIETLYQFEKNLRPAEIDVGQINQVINNLLINANQAMEGKGKIEIKARNFVKDETHKLPLENGSYICVTIRDNGPGIPKDKINKIFQPYYTTKETGSGLGLASCYSIIQRHGGYITVDSEVDVGTIFTMYLPVAEKEAYLPEARKDIIKKGQGHVLVMDDDREIANIVKQMLLISGYDVTIVNNGEDAIRILETGTPCSCAMLDLTVRGGMGALDIINKMKEVTPEIKSIITSGYSNDEVIQNYSKYGFDNSIIKPYQYEELVNALHSVLNNQQQQKS